MDKGKITDTKKNNLYKNIRETINENPEMKEIYLEICAIDYNFIFVNNPSYIFTKMFNAVLDKNKQLKDRCSLLNENNIVFNLLLEFFEKDSRLNPYYKEICDNLIEKEDCQSYYIFMKETIEHLLDIIKNKENDLEYKNKMIFYQMLYDKLHRCSETIGDSISWDDSFDTLQEIVDTNLFKFSQIKEWVEELGEDKISRKDS